ncbi:GNAT family N-acetyltransferase [Sphingobacterium pedocola]|uniref:GNAT family N-acetyltransferase n=1 Tax=Sphingobacterium pedocola TaxID=2082722 RepID=A0ABR9T609_9SPHI|nr:GNAT family N-acetyltransferase [Sphingobacterium pedocola]MBE8720514.1 GNAT family N-acetyltransferase [Sphingobacterium pedocola]
MIIQHQQETSKGRFVALEDGKQIGEMSYSVAGTDKIIIDRTEVDPEEKGKGIGHVMLYKAVEYARDNTIKILPLCPFAKASFDRDVNIRDVLFT